MTIQNQETHQKEMHKCTLCHENLWTEANSRPKTFTGYIAHTLVSDQKTTNKNKKVNSEIKERVTDVAHIDLVFHHYWNALLVALHIPVQVTLQIN